MKIKAKDIIKIANIVNGNTLIVKMGCMLHPNDRLKIQEDLQNDLPKMKVVILPNSIDSLKVE